jgi:hypothetical protein
MQTQSREKFFDRLIHSGLGGMLVHLFSFLMYLARPHQYVYWEPHIKQIELLVQISSMTRANPGMNARSRTRYPGGRWRQLRLSHHIF